MLKDFSDAGMIEWDGFGWGLHHILHIASYCILHHIASYCMAQQFTTPTMFQLLKSYNCSSSGNFMTTV